MTYWEIQQGHALDRLRDMPAESVQCVITSPPYYGLRDYGTGEWEGGDAQCDHAVRRNPRTDSSTLGGSKATTGHQLERFKTKCTRCGARRVDHQLGLEATPGEYVARLVEVFREVHRVLRDDGTLWLNVGDSYCGAGYANRDLERNGSPTRAAGGKPRHGSTVVGDGVKPKDLLGIPWMLALALRADGWYLRSEIIWAKPNPMPESVTDRPTSAHEKLFLLAKSGKPTHWTHPKKPGARSQPTPDYEWRHPETGERSREPQPKPWRRTNLWEGHDYLYDADAIREPDMETDHPRAALDGQASLEPSGGLRNDHGGIRTAGGRNGQGRNKRNVWTITTQPYPEAHFATFPEKLVEPCMLAGSSLKACGECGAPWRRVVERTTMMVRSGPSRDARRLAAGGASESRRAINGTMTKASTSRTIGWQPTCDHHDDTGQCVVLDPFAGSGTVGVVTLRHDRSFIGIELNPEYCEMARRRIRADAPLFNATTETTT